MGETFNCQVLGCTYQTAIFQFFAVTEDGILEMAKKCLVLTEAAPNILVRSSFACHLSRNHKQPREVSHSLSHEQNADHASVPEEETFN